MQKTGSGKLGEVGEAGDDDYTRPFLRSLIIRWRISKALDPAMTAKLRRPIAPAASRDRTLSDEAKRSMIAKDSQAERNIRSIINESVLLTRESTWRVLLRNERVMMEKMHREATKGLQVACVYRQFGG